MQITKHAKSKNAHKYSVSHIVATQQVGWPYHVFFISLQLRRKSFQVPFCPFKTPETHLLFHILFFQTSDQ